MKEALPIGSIVKMKTKEPDELMVIGYFPIDESTGTVRDYTGVLTPCGVISADSLYLFNEKDIEEVVYKGFTNPESENLLKDMPGSFDTIKNLSLELNAKREGMPGINEDRETEHENEDKIGAQSDTALDLEME